MTDYRLRQLGHQLKTGTARIVGKCGNIWTSTVEDRYIIEDLERCTTEHVYCCVRPSWEQRYLHA